MRPLQDPWEISLTTPFIDLRLVAVPFLKVKLGKMRRWNAPHAAVRPDLVVVLPPDGDGRSGLVQRLEPVVVQALVAELAVEAFDVAVLHGPARLVKAAIEVIKRKVGQHATHVFTFRGKPVTQVSTKAWRDALLSAGIDNFRWHDLRHTFATWHRQAGTPTHELQRLGGWKTLSMVERYAHVAPEGLQIATSQLDNALRGLAMATLDAKADRL